MKKQLRSIRNCCWKAVNMRQSTFTSLSVTTKWSTSMFLSKFYQDMRPLTHRAFLQLTLRHATTIRYTRVKMRRKLWDPSNRNSKVEICSKKMISCAITWWSLETEKMPCNICLLFFNCSPKLDSTWLSTTLKMTLSKRHSIWSKIYSRPILEST